MRVVRGKGGRNGGKGLEEGRGAEGIDVGLGGEDVGRCEDVLKTVSCGEH